VDGPGPAWLTARAFAFGTPRRRALFEGLGLGAAAALFRLLLPIVW
jgi:hypothetical protein